MDQIMVDTSLVEERKFTNKKGTISIIVVPITMVSFSGMHIHLGFQKLGSL
jgi:hypothetical protein